MYQRNHWEGMAAFIEAPRLQPKPCTLPQREPERRYMRLVDPPALSNERAAALSDSQEKALELIEEGKLEEAALTLEEGTWRNPEEELRQLIIYVRCNGAPMRGSDDDMFPGTLGKGGA